MKVSLLDTYQLIPQLLCDFRGMWVSWTIIRLIGPYDDSMGLEPLQTLVITELSL
jgi:hypothetical protein